MTKADTHKAWPVLFGLVIMIYGVSLVSMPIVYDTLHMTDTLFMLNSGRRVFLGLEPGVDYGTFYPGLTSRYLALSFGLFGQHARALDLSALLQYATLLPLACLVMAGRVSLLTLSGVAAVLATTLLTRAPMEEHAALTRMMSAHSFSYNRLGLALCLVPLLAVLLPAGPRRRDVLAGLAAGVAIAMALLCKWSFLVVLPPSILALALQRRWSMLAAMLAGLTATFLILDPAGQNFAGTFAYMKEAAAAEGGMGGIGGLLSKALRVVLSHLFTVLVVIAALIWVLRSGTEHRRAWGASVLLMMAGLGAACLVMGPFGLIGHQILPVAVTLLLILADRMQHGDMPIRALAILLGLALMLPHAGNAMLVTAASFGNRHETLVSQGPMVDYMQRYTPAAPDQAIDGINAQIAARISREGTVTRDLEYPVFADGLAALQELPARERHGVIAEGLINFEFAASTPPVTGYPLWPRITSPELSGKTRVPEGADIVLLLREGGTPLGDLLQGWMGEEFHLCLRTPIWNIFARIDARVEGCSTS